MSRLRDAALKYAANGWRVFPLMVEGKRPLFAKCADATELRGDALRDHTRDCSNDGHGLHDATIDTDKVEQWWTDEPRANIGVATGPESGFWVLDEDEHGAIKALCDAHDGKLHTTLNQITGSGGRHLLWRITDDTPDIGNRAGMDGHKVDVRGHGGYIVAPPSVHPNGNEYAWNGRTPLAEAPAWLVDAVMRTPMPDRTGTERADVQYVGAGSKWGLATLDGCCERLAQAAHGRNAALFREAVYAFGAAKAGFLDEQAARSALIRTAEGLKAYDTPGNPFTDHEILQTIGSAWSSADPVDQPMVDKNGKPYGEVCPVEVQARPAAQPEQAPPPEPPDTPTEPAPVERRWPIYTTQQLSDLPDPRWIIDGHVPEGFTVLYGPSGSMKSFTGLDWSMSVATGTPWLGHEVRSSPVVYIVAEASADADRRVKAWKADRSRKPDRLFTIAGAPNLLDPIDVDLLTRDVDDSLAGLLVVDTMARCMAGGDENSAQDVGRLVANLDKIRTRTGCSVLVVHHSGNEASRPRGSTALFAAADAVIRCTQDDMGDITLKCDKQKTAAPFRAWQLMPKVVGDSVVLTTSDAPSVVDDPSRTVRELLDQRPEVTVTAMRNAGLTDSHIAELQRTFAIERVPSTVATFRRPLAGVAL